jgi:DNA-binding CsgD family transcriptional regulator/tetratricopeptide (TPR) repeat protein
LFFSAGTTITGHPGAGGAPFVGRRDEMRVLDRVLERGAGQVVSVSGEAWSGKTRLAGELAAVARSRGWAVASGRAGRYGAGFEVVVDALDDHLAALGPEFADALGEGRRARLAGVFPALGAGERTRGTLPAPGTPDAYWLIRAVRAVLETAARPHGLLLVLDDAHRADPLSLELVDHLARHPAREPLVTVLAYRGTPAERRLSALRARAAGAGRPWPHLELGPLADRDAAELLPPGLDPVRRLTVLRDAAGNPGLLHALPAGALAGVHSLAELHTGPPPVAPRALDLGALSPSAWRTACAAAVLGGSFTPAAVAEVAELTLDQVLDALDELESEALTAPDARPHHFRFRHPAVRAVVHASCDGGWRYGAEARALAVLRAQGAPVTVLAAHLEHRHGPGDHEAMLDGARADLLVSPAAVARRLEHVPGSGALRARALVLSGRPEAALRAYAETGARDVEWHALAHRVLGHWDAAAALLDGPADGTDGAAVGHELAHAALALDTGAAIGGGTAACWAERAARSAERRDDGSARAHALALLAAAHAEAERFPQAAQATTEASQAVAALPPEALASRPETLRQLTTAWLYVGRRHEAERALRTAFAFALERAHVPVLGWLAAGLARVALAAEDVREAASHADVAVAVARFTVSPPMLVEALLCRGRVHLAAGESGAARETAREAARLAQPLGGPWRRRAEERLRTVETVSRFRSGPDAPRAGGVAPPGRATLSRREAQVAVLVSEGCTNQQIAGRLQLSPRTVETYLSRIFKKYGVVSRAQVAHLVGREAERA